MTGNRTPSGPKLAHKTLIGVPPPPPSRRPSLSGMVVAPPPPPVRQKPPAQPAPVGSSAKTTASAAPDPVDLAFSRTLLADAPDVSVPAELEAAVFLPAGDPTPSPAEPSPQPMASPAPAAQPEAVAEPVPAASPYPAAPTERTPAPTATALEAEGAIPTPRPKVRTGVVVGITVAAIATGFGLTLLIGRAGGEAPKVASTTKPSPVKPAAPAAVAPEVAATPSKAAAIAAPAVRETPAVISAAASPEPARVPISNATAPSCRELLGNAFVDKTDPKAALDETQLGNRELVRGKVDASQAAFCKAALWDSEKVERWLNVAQIFLIRRDAKQAVEASGRALELDPKNARALEIQGDAFARLGKLNEARMAYLAAEARPEPDEDAQKWLVRRDLDEANRSLKSRDFVRAERLFRRVVVFDPGHAGAALGVATCLRRQNDQKAADDWERHAETLARSARR